METTEKVTDEYIEKTSTNMLLIPAGTFLMGSDTWGEFEGPVRKVFVDRFLMDETSVTNLEFLKFVDETDYITTAELKGSAMGYHKGQIQRIQNLNWRSYIDEGRQDHPVVLVSWDDATAFAKWAGKRLPTEAEWEKAARAGLEQKMYPWGDMEPKNSSCNWGKESKSYPATTSVKSFAANAFGLYDMAGNVWNWCNDWFSPDYYSTGYDTNPKGASEGITKVRRGASFNIIQTFRLRCANRGAYNPESYAINIGFRCVKDFK